MTAMLKSIENYFQFKTKVVWKNAFIVVLLHIFALYGIFLIPQTKFRTLLWAYSCGVLADIGLCLGAHRLWSHRSYTAALPMRIFLLFCYMLAGQYSIVSWVRDHRCHHKFTETDADPQNPKRGMLFAHCGWIMMKRHPQVMEKGKGIDISDLWADPVVHFQQTYFKELFLVVHVLFPSSVAYFLLGESAKNSIFVVFFLRYIVALNTVWCLSSFLHIWGHRPYNKNTTARQNGIVSLLMLGEGSHNYHHTFPWDYRSAELGHHHQLGSHIIKFCEYLGLASNLKTASPELISKVIAKQNMPAGCGLTEMELNDIMNSSKFNLH